MYLVSFPNKLVGAKYNQIASAQAEPSTEKEITSASIGRPVSQRPYKPACRKDGCVHSGAMSLKIILISNGGCSMYHDKEVTMLTSTPHIGPIFFSTFFFFFGVEMEIELRASCMLARFSTSGHTLRPPL